MKTRIPLLVTTCALVAGCAGTSHEPELITWRVTVFDTTFLQGRKETPRVDDIIFDNLETTITLRGVFAVPPKHHADLCMLIKAQSYSTVTVRPDLIKSFDDNIYSDVILGLKSGSLCRVQHSHEADEGLTIRVVRDGAMTYIRPTTAIDSDKK